MAGSVLEGSCLCGDVTWEAPGPFTPMHHCHCSRCRKSHGTPFATFFGVPREGFRFLEGADGVRSFASGAPGARAFCGRCGSVLPGAASEGPHVFVPAASVDGDPGVRPIAHIFVGSKAPWYEICDAALQFDTLPPGYALPPLDDRPPLDPETGEIRGSCLCGGISFALAGPPQRVWNCHCQRCRKARAAVHACNAFFPADAIRFTRGEALRVSYKVEDARFFQQHFCRVCGSKVPRPDPERKIVVVPMGSLDDDPGMRPQRHIFVASKAPWFEIADDLPQSAGPPR